MYKKIALIFLSIACNAQAFCDNFFRTEWRFSVGPAWHSFLSYEEFNLASPSLEPTVLSTELIALAPEFMPYVEGRLRCYINDCVNITLLAAGTGGPRGRSEVDGFIEAAPDILVKGRREALTQINIAVVDLAMGAICKTPFSNVRINPSFGYVLNIEKLILSALSDATHKLLFHNQWFGGYVGVEIDWQLLDCISVRPMYKAIFGQVDSLLIAQLPADELAIYPDTARSFRYAPILGNIFAIDALYRTSFGHIGVNCSIQQYKNTCPGNVILGPQEPVIVNSASMTRLMYNQINLAFFAEVVF